MERGSSDARQVQSRKDQTEAQRSGFGLERKKEGADTQVSPQGGNEVERASSDVRCVPSATNSTKYRPASAAPPRRSQFRTWRAAVLARRRNRGCNRWNPGFAPLPPPEIRNPPCRQRRPAGHDCAAGTCRRCRAGRTAPSAAPRRIGKSAYRPRRGSHSPR